VRELVDDLNQGSLALLREAPVEMETTGSAIGELTVLFIDLVRFTALTEVHGDIAGADAASALVEVVADHLGDGARLVKTLGDGVLITTPAPVFALQTAAAVVEGLHDLDIGLDARVGAHHGPVVERDGDVFGSTVNLSSRAASLAAPGRIVATRPVAESVTAANLAATPLGEQPVKGFMDPIELFEIDPCEHGGDWITDPVCGMRLSIAHIRAQGVYETGEVGFCSRRCAAIFDSGSEGRAGG
jgi:adenylate cyclase